MLLAIHRLQTKIRGLRINEIDQMHEAHFSLAVPNTKGDLSQPQTLGHIFDQLFLRFCAEADGAQFTPFGENI
jgi:hypothetical protein